MPQASHNPCKFVAALRIQGITPALGDNFSVYNALFDPYENARTAGICGRRGGRSRPLSFLLLYFRRLPSAPKIGQNPLERPCRGSYPPHPPRGHIAAYRWQRGGNKAQATGPHSLPQNQSSAALKNILTTPIR